jgi:hypothetical protein
VTPPRSHARSSTEGSGCPEQAAHLGQRVARRVADRQRNTSEIVDFKAPVAGSYEIRVVNFRCARSSFVGWAHTNG